MIYRTLLDPLLLPIPISPPHSSIRLSSCLGARRKRRDPFRLRMKDFPAGNPVGGFVEKT